MEINGYNISPRANLREANLSEANLSRANLREANLSRANLREANLSRANLRGAYLSRANLREAYLSEANLSEANLRGAYLSEADLSGAVNVPPLPWTIIVPEGDLIVYKKLREGVCTLLIPRSAKRVNATGRKCRAEFAVVEKLPSGFVVGTSIHDKNFRYRLGETVKPVEPFCEDRWNECSSGIHFFLTREEAENY